MKNTRNSTPAIKAPVKPPKAAEADHAQAVRSRHGKTKDGRRRVSYIENEEVYATLVEMTKRLRIDSTSTLIREAIHRFVKANGDAKTLTIEGD